jgi:hypothetical protein
VEWNGKRSSQHPIRPEASVLTGLVALPLPRTRPGRLRLAIWNVTHLSVWPAHERRAVHTDGSATTAALMCLAARGDNPSPSKS